jgi:hypothetical protein
VQASDAYAWGVMLPFVRSGATVGSIASSMGTAEGLFIENIIEAHAVQLRSRRVLEV